MIEHKPRTGGRKKRPAPAAPLDPLHAAIGRVSGMDRSRMNFSEDTVNTRRAYLGYFHRLVPRARPGEAHRDHAADPGTLPALALSLPQDQRPAARPSARSTRGCSPSRAGSDGWRGKIISCTIRLPRLMLPRLEHRLPKYVLNGRGSRAGDSAARRHRCRGPARSRHPGDVLLDRDAAHGTGAT